MKEIRESIADGRFLEWRDEFLNNYEDV